MSLIQTENIPLSDKDIVKFKLSHNDSNLLHIDALTTIHSLPHSNHSNGRISEMLASCLIITRSAFNIYCEFLCIMQFCRIPNKAACGDLMKFVPSLTCIFHKIRHRKTKLWQYDTNRLHW